MNKQELKQIIKEELGKILNEKIPSDESINAYTGHLDDLLKASIEQLISDSDEDDTLYHRSGMEQAIDEAGLSDKSAGITFYQADKLMDKAIELLKKAATNYKLASKFI